MKTVVFIPARMGSTRFPGKPLAKIGGTPMVIRVWQNVCKAVSSENIYILTDDSRIMDAADSFDAKALMTSAELGSGTERIASVLDRFDQDIIVNMQGDEPFFPGDTLKMLIDEFKNEEAAPVLSAYFPLSPSEAVDPNKVKVALDNKGYALYFSRSPIPAHGPFYKHIGIYLYKNDFVREYTSMKPGKLETSEKLEQLRVLENGYKIRMIRIKEDTLGIDTPEDLKKAEELYGK